MQLYRAFVLLMFMAVGSGHERTNAYLYNYLLDYNINMRAIQITLRFPAVPPKPAHLNSPVTEVSLPLGSGNLSVKPSMEGGVEGAIGKGRVSNLISRFEESR